MDGRNVFDILPWKIRCITSYRFRYKKGHAENIFSFRSSKTNRNVIYSSTMAEMLSVLRGICGNHFQSSIQSVRRGGQPTHPTRNSSLNHSNLELLSENQYRFNIQQNLHIFKISCNPENDVVASDRTLLILIIG